MAYIYGHYRADTGELFYIGKGTGRRAWRKVKRNPYWYNIVNKHGYTVTIIEDGLSDATAFRRETELINEYGLENLANMTEGGKGLTSDKAKEIMNRPEVKKKQREGLLQRYQNIEYRERLRASHRNKVYTDEWRTKQAEYASNRFKDDPTAYSKWLENSTKAAQARARNPDWLEKTRKRTIEQAKDPEYRKKVSEGLKRKWAERKLNQKVIE